MFTSRLQKLNEKIKLFFHYFLFAGMYTENSD